MKKLLTGVMFAVLGTSVFAGATIDRIIASKTLNVGARANSVPYSFQNSRGSYEGMSQDFVKEVAKDFEKKYNVSLTIAKQEVTGQTRQILVTSGAIDIEGGSTTATEARYKVVNFSILDADPVILSTLATTKNINSLEDLKGKRVAVVAGTTAETIIKKLNAEKAWSTTVIGVKDYPAGFALLEQGRVDGVSTNGVLMAGEIAKLGDKFKLQPQVIVGPAELIGVMFGKDDAEFTALVQGTMARMKADGSLEKLYAKWFSQPIPNIGNLNMRWTPAQKKLVFESK